MRSRKSFSIKINILKILQISVLYLILGVVQQAILMNGLFASEPPEDNNLRDVKVKISREDSTLEQAFQTIEQQTDFKFFYIREDLPLHKIVAIPPAENTFYEILQKLAKECGLKFSRVDNQIVVKKDSTVRSKTFKMRGVVRDGSTHESLVFANIMLKGTQQGITTDANGKFMLNLPQENDTLCCSYVGYRTVEIPTLVKADTQLSISLFATDVFLQDVTVYANPDEGETSQKEVSALSLQSETIGKITGLMPDVLRSVQMLPGVSNDNELSAKFNVHGGDENENLVLIDGTEVYEPYHVKEASNVSIGVFDVDMIEKMDLITGGFSARYGDKMSSVLDIEYREGSRDRIKGQVSLSMTDFDALLEGPIGTDGSFIIGARQSYLQYEMKLIGYAPQVHPSYNDVQGVLAFQLMPQDKLLLKFIYAGDTFTYDPTTSSSNAYTNSYHGDYGYIGSLSQSWHDSSEEHAHYNTDMIAIQNSYIISSSALLKSEVSFYDELESEHSDDLYLYGDKFHSGNINAFYNSASNYLYDNNLRIRTLEFNSSYDMQVTHFYSIKAGANYQRIYYYQDMSYQETFSYSTNNYRYPIITDSLWNINGLGNVFGNIDAQSFKATGYLENIFQIGERTILNVGGRYDYFELNKDLTWSPRVNIAYKACSEITLRGAWGYFYQSPIYEQLAYSTASDTNTQSQRAIHYILGTDFNLISDVEDHNILKLKLDAYYKTYINLISSTVSSSGNIYYSRKNDAIGNASGLDAYLMYSTSGISGWISYSLLKAEQKLVANDTLGYFPRNTDQRNTIAVVADFNLGKSWSMNTRMVFGSGYPYTPEIAVYNKLSFIVGMANGES